jgi:putative glutamine amidotransferase
VPKSGLMEVREATQQIAWYSKSMEATNKPVIGITCGEVRNKIESWSPAVTGQSRTYVQSIIDAGGLPILLPMTDDKVLLQQLIAMLDGLYLAGGNDIHPQLYGQEPDSTTVDFSTLRDTTETILLTMAMSMQMPVLGICRGMQMLNIHLGGNLIQDIPTAMPDALDHNVSNKIKKLIDASHPIRLDAQSRLAEIIGPDPIGANEHHHQAIDKLGTGVTAVGWADDDIIEAIELRDYPFAIGIQAHPESLTEVEPRWQHLFNAFINASRRP